MNHLFVKILRTFHKLLRLLKLLLYRAQSSIIHNTQGAWWNLLAISCPQSYYLIAERNWNNNLQQRKVTNYSSAQIPQLKFQTA